jgi:hypothetical protein
MSKTTLALFTTLAFLLAACGGAAPTPDGGDPAAPGSDAPAATAEPTLEPTAEPTAGPATGTGVCAHQFYPVVLGATHTYTASSATFGSTTFTDTITDVRADGFTLTSEFDGLTRTQEWECTAEGISALQFSGGGAAAGITASGVNGTFETTNATGVSLPANVALGDTWQQSFDITGQMSMAEGMSASAVGSASYDFTAVAVEEVQTSAGTFSALRVEGVLTLTLQVDFEGMQVPLTLTSESTSWFAEGIGWVKSEDTTTVAGSESFESTVDMESYAIP